MTATYAPHMPLRTPPSDCARCGRGPLIPKAIWVAGGRRGVMRGPRGLCRPCYHDVTVDGTLTDYPTFHWPPLDHAAVVARYEELKATPLTMKAIAEDIGISVATLYTVLRKAGYQSPTATRYDDVVPSPLPEEEAARLRRLVGIG